MSAICPQCFREVPRTLDDPEGSWEKCADCDGLFLAGDTKIPKPEKTRISIQRDRERISFRCPSRMPLLWRLPLAILTLYFAFMLLVGCGMLLGVLAKPFPVSPLGLLVFGWITYQLGRSVFGKGNLSTLLDCDGDTMTVHRREILFRSTTKIPMSEIIRLESKPLKETEKEKERSLTFHYFDSKHQPKGLTIYLASQAEENWMLDELHDFLKSTPSGSPMVPFAYWANHPSDTLMVRPVGDSMFVQVFCRRCGMKIPAADLDLKTGEAVCRQKNCGERFNWWEIPHDPEPSDAEVKTFRRIFATYSDVRTFHFSDVVNPFTAPFQPRNPIPLSSLRKPKRSDVSRPAISWGKERLRIQIAATKSFGVFQCFGIGILSIALFFLVALACFMPTMMLLLAFFGESSPKETPVQIIGGIIGALLFGGAAVLIYNLLAINVAKCRGLWTVEINPESFRYRRRCFFWSGRGTAIPLEKLNGFYVVSQQHSDFAMRPERFANFFVRFDVGKKSYFFPCGSEEHRNWVASEIVDYLAVHGWDAGNGVVQKINNELRPNELRPVVAE